MCRSGLTGPLGDLLGDLLRTTYISLLLRICSTHVRVGVRVRVRVRG